MRPLGDTPVKRGLEGQSGRRGSARPDARLLAQSRSPEPSTMPPPGRWRIGWRIIFICFSAAALWALIFLLVTSLG